jgi:hypothetical protein
MQHDQVFLGIFILENVRGSLFFWNKTLLIDTEQT